MVSVMAEVMKEERSFEQDYLPASTGEKRPLQVLVMGGQCEDVQVSVVLRKKGGELPLKRGARVRVTITEEGANP
jgi:hypothetical protein